MFSERRTFAQEQIGRNWKINLGKNVECEDKLSITSLLASEIYRGRKERQTGVSTGRGGEEKERKQRL